MRYKAKELVDIRKKKWEELQDIEYDSRLRNAFALEILKDKALIDEIKKNPEYLIEMVFVVVDKEQNTIPFFLNDVQKNL